ncbi:MAG: hypothetical protein WAM72_00735 [Xanthobacteraceae bacterium]
MNGWLDRIAADVTISPRAHQIARIIVERFAGPYGDSAKFYDADVGAFIDLPNDDIRSLRLQLQQLGYLHPIQSGGNGKPSYQLRHGRPIEAGGGGEAA